MSTDMNLAAEVIQEVNALLQQHSQDVHDLLLGKLQKLQVPLSSSWPDKQDGVLSQASNRELSGLAQVDDLDSISGEPGLPSVVPSLPRPPSSAAFSQQAEDVAPKLSDGSMHCDRATEFTRTTRTKPAFVIQRTRLLHESKCSSVLACVRSNMFEGFFASLIALNTVFMALEYQYRGMAVAAEMKLPGAVPPLEVWPWGELLFLASEWCFGLAFTAELALKLLSWGVQFLKDPWNYLDFLVVVCWILDRLESIQLPIDPLVLRMARLAKIVRLVKLFKTIKAFDSLYLLTASIKASMSALMWSGALILVALLLVALGLSVFLLPFCVDASKPMEDRVEVYRYFGTFSKSMLSMFELTLGNWVPITRVLSEKVSEFYAVVLMGFQLVLGFAVIKVISGVFLTETMKVASMDDSIMLKSKERAMRVHREKMERLFTFADMDNSGQVDIEEFAEMLAQQDVSSWLASMDLEIHTVAQKDAIFRLLDVDGDGCITSEELARGIGRLKGAARNFDLVLLWEEVQRTRELLKDLQRTVKNLDSKIFKGGGSTTNTEALAFS